MNKQERQELLNKYMQERGISMRKFSAEIGYSEETLSQFKTGGRKIPNWLLWGLQQGMKVLKLQEKLINK